MIYDLYLKNATVVTETAVFSGGVVVHQGKISHVAASDVAVDARKTVDLKGKLLLPGLVDEHAHLNEPGRTHWEGYKTGSMAAAAGGITTVLDMPLNSMPSTTNAAILADKRQAVKDQAVIDYAQWGGLVDNNLEDLAGMHTEGVVAFKAFVSNSGIDDFARLNDDVLYAGLLASAAQGFVIGVHAENEYVTAYLGQKLRQAGRNDRAAWYESRPPEAELEAVQRACYWAKVTGGNLMVVHVSIAEGIKAIDQAKRSGARVYAETCPHYLFFDQEDFVRIGPALKGAPPVRSRAEVEAMWQCVLDGMVDAIGSDHSPSSWDEKEKGLDNIWTAWGGLIGNQCMLPALLTAGVHQHNLPLPLLVKMTSANPARIFGLYPQKGAILPGSDADLVVVDLDKEWTLKPEQLFNKDKHSPYVGYSFKGCVEQTLVRGETVYQDGQIRVQPGFGRLLRRQSTT